MYVRKRNLQRIGGIEGNCLILRSPPLKQVNDSVLTLTVCVIKTNGTLRIGDEDIDVGPIVLLLTTYIIRRYFNSF